MNDEIKCYGLHIKVSDFDKVVENNGVVDILKKYDGAGVAMSKDPMKYCASLVFKDEKDRNQAIKALKDIGINAVMEIAPAFVDKRYAKESWLEGTKDGA